MKKYPLWTILWKLWLIFLWAVLGIWVYTYNQDAIEPKIHQEREVSNYKFINPLIECEIQTLWNQQKYIPFESEIQEKIKTEVLEKNPDISISYYFRNLRNGPWFGYNEKASFSPASLMKLPVSMAYMKWSEEYPALWNLSFTWILENKSFQNITPSHHIIEGNQYSIDTLISTALIYSDNDANTTLTRNIPDNLLLRVFRELNIPIIDELQNGSDEYINVQEYASFFRILFNASYLSRTSSEYLLEIMSRSENERWIRKSIPKDITVSHKFGERWILDPMTGKIIYQFHDCGIIYYEKYPYLLCVMTKWDASFDRLEWIIENISESIFEIIYKKYQ